MSGFIWAVIQSPCRLSNHIDYIENMLIYNVHMTVYPKLPKGALLHEPVQIIYLKGVHFQGNIYLFQKT